MSGRGTGLFRSRTAAERPPPETPTNPRYDPCRLGTTMWNDTLVAARTLLKRPGYAISVVVTLAVGIGASTVMFSLLDAALIRPLPFAEPGRLVFLTGVAGPQRAPRGGSFPEVRDWRTMNQTLQDVSSFDDTSLNLRLGDQVIRVEAEMVNASYFPLLGVSPSVGRPFLADEDAVPDRNRVAVISHALWRTRFGQDRDVLSRTVQLNDQPFAIVGVMPEGFSGVSFDTDVWVPAAMLSLTSGPGLMQDRGSRWLGRSWQTERRRDARSRTGGSDPGRGAPRTAVPRHEPRARCAGGHDRRRVARRYGPAIDGAVRRGGAVLDRRVRKRGHAAARARVRPPP